MNEKEGISRSEDLFREFLSRWVPGEDIIPEEYFTNYTELEGEVRKLFSKLDAGETEEVDLLSGSGLESSPKYPLYLCPA